MNEKIRSFLFSSELCLACGRKSNRVSREHFHPKLGDKVDTEEGPLGDRRMSKPVLLVMRRKGEKVEEERVWKYNRKGRWWKTKDKRWHRGMCIWQDGGQPATKK